MLRSKNKYNFSFIFGLIILILGIVIISYDYILRKKIEVFETKNIALLESELPDNIENDADIPNEEPPIDGNEEDDTQTEEPVEVIKPKPVDYSKYYIGTLEIPKIKLKKGFLEIDSPYNNVDKNVTVIQTSSYPDVDKGNFILAAHSGNSSISFFTKLHDLKVGDLAYITYKSKKYTYELVDIYLQPKVGTISIYRDTENTTLTLVTCTLNDSTSQTVFILELINVE